MAFDLYNEKVCTVWMTLVFGISNPIVNFLISKYKSAEASAAVLREHSAYELKTLFYKYDPELSKYKKEDAEKILDICDKSGIDTILYCDEKYPELLRNIYNPPAVLYFKGNYDFSKNPLKISFVGTRKPTEYSMKIARAMSGAVARCGFDVVSGFAVGIDITTELAAVKAGGKTIAVLGSGINYNYPKDNMKYRELICKNGGFLSEYPPEFSPTRYSFPPRNRIIAGISLGTAVIEAGAKSGSLITANYCNDQGKPLFVIPPGDITNICYGGNVSLIRDGAIPLMGVSDIVYEFYSQIKYELNDVAEHVLKTGEYIYSDVYKPVGSINTKIASESDEDKKEEEKDVSDEALEKLLKRRKPDRNPNKKEKKDKKSDESKNTKKSTDDENMNGDGDEKSEEAPKETNEKKIPDLSVLSGIYKLIAETITELDRPALGDEIADIMGVSPDDVLSILTEMEIDGTVSRTAGGAYILCL